jgi:hypothetical protein
MVPDFARFSPGCDLYFELLRNLAASRFPRRRIALEAASGRNFQRRFFQIGDELTIGPVFFGFVPNTRQGRRLNGDEEPGAMVEALAAFGAPT